MSMDYVDERPLEDEHQVREMYDSIRSEKDLERLMKKASVEASSAR